jgi:hypothetical protein
VQSTTVLLMSQAGEMPPLDVAIFADTQSEPVEVYAHLDRLTAAVSIPVVRVTAGDLADTSLNIDNKLGVAIPAFIRLSDGSSGITHRTCTERFKIRPIRNWIKANRDGRHVDQSFGISLDEIHRMRHARDDWMTHRYPLVDARMTRHDCHRWLAAHGWSAPRSACYFCPYHSDDEWRRLQADPNEWARAVAFDRQMRQVNAERRANPEISSLRADPYLHRSVTPLSEVDLSTPEDHGQGSLFGSECGGYCGV